MQLETILMANAIFLLLVLLLLALISGKRTHNTKVSKNVNNDLEKIKDQINGNEEEIL